VLAINFIALAGFVGWVVKSQHVNREKALAIKDLIFGAPTPAPATQPVVDATTQPSLRLEELVARQSGHTASEQVEFIQHTFDTQMAQLDRREREVRDLERQVDLAKLQMTRDRDALEAEKKQLKDREEEAARLASDKGFQDALDRYIAMPPKQVKDVFTKLDDPTVVRFLQAMEPRIAAKVIKEFKTPDEMTRIQKVLEMMRQAQASAKDKG
jgi:flagellar motility protein MotE (MotC chaperone)